MNNLASILFHRVECPRTEWAASRSSNRNLRDSAEVRAEGAFPQKPTHTAVAVDKRCSRCELGKRGQCEGTQNAIVSPLELTRHFVAFQDADVGKFDLTTSISPKIQTPTRRRLPGPRVSIDANIEKSRYSELQPIVHFCNSFERTIPPPYPKRTLHSNILVLLVADSPEHE